MTRATLTVKSGDKYPTYWHVPMDLTDATVRLIARRGSNPAITLSSSISDATQGVVEHILDGTLVVGNYAVELEISIHGMIITAPTATYENLRVIADLD